MWVIVRQSVFSLLALVCIGLSGAAQADPSPIGVALDQRVIDLTNTLDAGTTTRLKDQLAALEQRKGAQVAVLLVPSIGDASLEDYANQLFRAWKLGRKDINDGILLLVAKDDRKVRIEVGYGLEGAMPDAVASRIIRNVIAPPFKAGQFDQGMAAGLIERAGGSSQVAMREVDAALAKFPKVSGSGAQQPPARQSLEQRQAVEDNRHLGAASGLS